MITLGLIVNPVAGMGGRVGLKGTDGAMYAKALSLGAEPVSPRRTEEFLSHLHTGNRIRLLVAPGAMGADHAAGAGLAYETIGEASSEPSAADTRAIAARMLGAGVDIIAFAGGDGTARDIVDAIDLQLPVIGIPSGVKVYSAVFAYSPRAAAELAEAFVDGAGVIEEEVLDIDEDAFRADRVESRHYGFLLIPEVAGLTQAGKESSGGAEAVAEAKQEIGAHIAEEMQAGTLYLLGSGTTLRAICDALGIEKTLLGVDAVADGRLIGSDLNERAILELLDQYGQVRIIVTPLGGNGFIFGRGNKQFTPKVLRRVGREHIVVVGNKDKLMKLSSLHVDTGDPELDASFAGYIDVTVGRNYRKLMRVQ